MKKKAPVDFSLRFIRKHLTYTSFSYRRNENEHIINLCNEFLTSIKFDHVTHTELRVRRRALKNGIKCLMHISKTGYYVLKHSQYSTPLSYLQMCLLCYTISSKLSKEDRESFSDTIYIKSI